MQKLVRLSSHPIWVHGCKACWWNGDLSRTRREVVCFTNGRRVFGAYCERKSGVGGGAEVEAECIRVDERALWV